MCEVCQKSDWSIDLPTTARTPAIPALGTGPGGLPAIRQIAGALPVFLLICNHCGNVRMFSMGVFYEWRKTAVDKPKSKE